MSGGCRWAGFQATEIIISQTDTRNPRADWPPWLFWIPRPGKPAICRSNKAGISRVAVSPDGSTIAYAAPVTDPATKAVKADVFVVPATRASAEL